MTVIDDNGRPQFGRSQTTEITVMPYPQELVKAKHVRLAAKRWRREGYGSFRESLSYDVIIGGEPFPPKAICALALDIATTGRVKLKSTDFPGLKNGDWHQRLDFLGFSVEPKNVDRADDLELFSTDDEMIDHRKQVRGLQSEFWPSTSPTIGRICTSRMSIF